jgi:hypothetical protein
MIALVFISTTYGTDYTAHRTLQYANEARTRRRSIAAVSSQHESH